MSLRGSAILALWNDVDPVREAEYNDWHTFQHVPERVGIPGFISGRRYVASGRRGPRYFTLYELENLAAMVGPAYDDVVLQPTEWSRLMRPAFRNVIRRACAIGFSVGIGAAKAIATVGLKLDAAVSADAIEAARIALEPLVQTDGIVAVHLGIAKQPARVYPIELGGAAEDPRGHEELVLLVECLDTVKATLMVDAALGLLRKAIGVFQSNGETVYEIASWFDRSQLPQAAAPRASGQPRRRR
jgi:hypothetical protein